MKIFFNTKWLPVWLLVATSTVYGDEEANSEVDKAAVEQSIAEIAEVHDPIIEGYVDLGRLDAAWTFLDAEAMADIAVRLAEAERILFRQHPAISSEEIMKLAVRTAGVTKQTKALDILEQYAQKRNNRELSEQVDLARKLAGASRSVAPTLSLDDVSLGAFIAYKQAQHDLNAALVYGSLEMMKDLQEQLAAHVEKDPAIWTKLKQQVDDQVRVMESLGGASRDGNNEIAQATNAINKLVGATRRSPWHQGGQQYGGRYQRGGGQWGNRYPANQYPGNQYPGNQFQGQNFQQNTQLNYWQNQQLQVQRPGAMVGGATMMGIAGALNQKNPQKNAVAAGILGAIGQGLILSSNPGVQTQGGMTIQQQGQTNQWGGGFQ